MRCTTLPLLPLTLALSALLSACDSPDGSANPHTTDASDTSTSPDTFNPSDASDTHTSSDIPSNPDTNSNPDTTTPPPDTPFLTTLPTPADLAFLSTATDTDIKFLLPAQNKTPIPPLLASCYFQNMRLYAWHILFLHSFPAFADLAFDAYVNLTLRAPSRIWWGGSVQTWPAVLHPRTQQSGIISYTIYNEHRSGELTAESIIEVDRTLRACIPFAGDLLAFVPSDSDQQQTTQRLHNTLTAEGVAVVWPQDLIEGLVSISYSEGENYGYLKRIPKGQPLGDYGPRDVVILQSAPPDISLVAGLLTEDPQNLHSHVNLRLQEKGIPNATLPGALQNALITSLDNQLVHLRVTADAVTLTAARLEDAQAFWDAHSPAAPPPTADLSVTNLSDFRDIGAADSSAYGAKAANLAELQHILPAPHRPEGFGIPFARYRDFTLQNHFDLAAEALLSDPRIRTDALYLRQRLETFRNQIIQAPLDPAFFAALQAQAVATLGPDATTRFLRFRSSTNVEDLTLMTGAGLYDSRTGCIADDLDADSTGPSHCLDPDTRAGLLAQDAALRAELQEHPDRTWIYEVLHEINEDLTEEKPASKALKKVWASLWNERAFVERDFYKIDHRLAFMGVAVSHSFIFEQVNAVLITQLDTQNTHRLISQVGDESVVRPLNPTAIAEVITFQLTPEGTVEALTRWLDSSLSPGGVPLWTPENLAILADLTRTVQAHFAANVYPEVQPLRLDMEVKIDAAGEVVIKQARPYVTAP